MVYCRLGAASALHLSVSYVHESVEEGSRSNYDGFCAELYAPDGPHADDTLGLLVDKKLVGLVLEDVKVRRVVEDSAPLPDELSAVALRTWAPYCRPLGAVQHAELYRRGVRYHSHLSSEGINLTDYLPLGYSADSRVTTHLSDFIHVHGDETCPGSNICRGRCGLTSGVSAAYYKNIVIEIHYLSNKLVGRKVSVIFCIFYKQTLCFIILLY